jgi:multidrug efflux pump
MDPSSPFIRRPVGTTLLTIGLAAAGAVAFLKLPISPLPQVDFPTISVEATLPGANPPDVATTVAGPLERHLGQIADVVDMISSSTMGSTHINLQFGLSRDINGAARDVQAAINAARADLPSNLQTNPIYHKVNPADAPVMVLALTSDTVTRGSLYDAASTILAAKLSQVDGIGEVTVSGSSSPAVRVELFPQALFKYGIGLEDVRAALANANAHSPKGGIDVRGQRYQIYANDQAYKADDYNSLIIGYRNNAPVRLSDVGYVADSIENLRTAGLLNGKAAVLINLYRKPGANVVSTVDRVKDILPKLRASIPASIELESAFDRSKTVRSSLRDVERTLIAAALLALVVVFAFLRNLRATLVPVVAVPVSLIATFAAMYLFGCSVNNLSLIALTIATGFIIDDSIVVLENVTRCIEHGLSPLEAAFKGARQVVFTVLSMSISLVAVFIPVLLMGGIVGRMLREFAVTISSAILISLAITLTTTPMMCAVLLRKDSQSDHGPLYRASGRLFDGMLNIYRRSLAIALEKSAAMLLVFGAVLCLNFCLYEVIPKGLFPQQDTGQLVGFIVADQSTSFQRMQEKLSDFAKILRKDSAIQTVVAITPVSSTNTGLLLCSLYPLSKREISTEQVIARLRSETNVVPAATLYMQAIQDIQIGSRISSGRYQLALLGSTFEELNEWTPKVVEALQRNPNLVDVNSDLQSRGLESNLVIDRDAAARLGITVNQIDNTLYDAFGQRQVSTVFLDRNQYHVIMEVSPEYWQNPETLKDVYISTSAASVSGSQATNAVTGSVVTTTAVVAASSSNAQAARNLATNSIGATSKGTVSTGSAISTNQETMIPLSAVARFIEGVAPLAVNHQGVLVASTISFNLPPNGSLGVSIATINEAMNRIGVPATIHGAFRGTAKAYQDAISSQPYLVLAAIVTIYVVLGVLYESFVHPLTILSALPSAGVGALLALLAFKIEFNFMALIGVILLSGLSMKNAIILIDFALAAERDRGLSSRDAIQEACMLRLRPITMTSMAGILGALPLAIGVGEGGEFRQPLGIAIIGGLILNQALTLYSTPVIYLYFDRLRS